MATTYDIIHRGSVIGQISGDSPRDAVHRYARHHDDAPDMVELRAEVRGAAPRRFVVDYDRMNIAQKSVRDLHLDFVNNFLTVGRFASHYGFSVPFTEALLAEGRRLEEHFTVEE